LCKCHALINSQIQGVITPEQRESISNINGHSSSTTKDYYVKLSRHDDVSNTVNAFDAFQSQYASPSKESIIYKDQQCTSYKDENIDWKALFDDGENCNIMDSVNLFDSNVAMQINPYTSIQPLPLPVATLNLNEGIIGLKHPDQNEKARKAKWTDEEVDIVGEWCLSTLQSKPEWGPCIISKCLSHIMKNKSIREVFHPIHIASSARLRYGYDKYRIKHGIPVGIIENLDSIEV
jgi:hypothetical protein